MANNQEYAKCIPIYKTFKGWNEDLSNIRKYKDLPLNAKKYIEYISKTLNLPISYISVGSDRKQTIKV
jgi:adenylosuccinate synthase